MFGVGPNEKNNNKRRMVAVVMIRVVVMSIISPNAGNNSIPSE